MSCTWHLALISCTRSCNTVLVVELDLRTRMGFLVGIPSPSGLPGVSPSIDKAGMLGTLRMGVAGAEAEVDGTGEVEVMGEVGRDAEGSPKFRVEGR